MTSAAARDFLERACAACRHYDRDASFELPFDVWPNILDDLNLDDSGQGCKFLMEHLSAAADGKFTYLPLLEALDGGPPMSGPSRGSPPPGARGGDDYLDFDAASTQRLPPGDDAMPPPADAGAAARYGLFGSDVLSDQAGGYDAGGRGRSDDGLRGRGGGPSDYDGGYAGGRGGELSYGGSDVGYPSGSGGGGAGGSSVPYDTGYSSACGGSSAAPPAPLTSENDSRRPYAVRAPYAHHDHEPPRQQHADDYASRAPYADHQRIQPQWAGGGDALQRSPPSGRGGDRDDGSMADRPMGRMDTGGGDQSSFATEEVNDQFWARRAATIQELYRLWDCNQLSNDAFTARLQEVFGDVVDIASPDSEFGKLANKHRSARNMKFAALMSALRRDAQATHARRFGRPMSHSGLSQYAGSYAPSNYEPSDVGSDAAAQAAGRPTGVAAVQPSLRAGRRHYYAESHMSGSSLTFAEEERRARAEASRLAGVDERGPFPPYAADDGGAGSGRIPPTPQGGVGGGGSVAGDMYGSRRPVSSRADAGSAAGSDFASVADSQRAEFTQRNRTGHGNILTWGNDSRNVTPGKQRPGRQITVDPQQGIPRANVASGVLPGSQGGY